MDDLENKIKSMQDVLGSLKDPSIYPVVTDNMLRDDIIKTAIDVKQAFDDFYFNVALKRIWEHIALCNKYFQCNEPWKSVKTNPEEAQYVFYVVARSLESMAILISPVMPEASEKILQSLGIDKLDVSVGVDYIQKMIKGDFRSSYNLQPGEPLFMKINKSDKSM